MKAKEDCKWCMSTQDIEREIHDAMPLEFKHRCSACHEVWHEEVESMLPSYAVTVDAMINGKDSTKLKEMGYTDIEISRLVAQVLILKYIEIADYKYVLTDKGRDLLEREL